MAGWGRFTASLLGAALVGTLMLTRFSGPFRKFFIERPVEEEAETSTP